MGVFELNIKNTRDTKKEILSVNSIKLTLIHTKKFSLSRIIIIFVQK